ncbi:hypothetical protein L2E82_33556 [Cichorium intybus]|uniref:Uncharacterized protein n=1 Tax=Cichorium intybus TaxID=13427 RepID=A0ACB9BKH3_CICIN|nr:hypothetical protein L1887_10397 [Cichorium endivia]KAI3722517.1 hypothetical protein L2E82_33556 [Cichorium intybus]
MGLFARILLSIWLMGGTAGSIYLLGRRALEIGVRMVHLHSETCLEDVVLWPTYLMTGILVTCLLGLVGIVCCKVKFFHWLFSFLIYIGFLYLVAIMIWRLLMFGWIRKPTSVTFDEVYKDSSPLDEEYKPMLIDAMAADHVWPMVDECLTKIKFCEEDRGPEKFIEKDEDWKIETYYEYFREGCCVPPPRCARKLFTLESVDENDDCVKWANATLKKPEHVKCYDCHSCKAARLATYITNQDHVSIYSAIAAVFLIFANLFVSMGGFE